MRGDVVFGVCGHVCACVRGAVREDKSTGDRTDGVSSPGPWGRDEVGVWILRCVEGVYVVERS